MLAIAMFHSICDLNFAFHFDSSMRLYWVDAFFDKIEHSNFDGQNRISLDRITQISHPFGLTIFEGKNVFV